MSRDKRSLKSNTTRLVPDLPPRKKYYSGPVGNSAVQEAFSGKAYYDRDIAVVMTNSVFTQQAVDEAAKLKVKLWDGNKLREMQN